MNYLFLLIGDPPPARWTAALQAALQPLGELHIVSESDAVQAICDRTYDVVIIDAGQVSEPFELTGRLRQFNPETQVIIATASPTWQRARQALRAGAVDYIRKSLDEKDLRGDIQAVLKIPPASQAR